jgi:hypothetical protein
MAGQLNAKPAGSSICWENARQTPLIGRFLALSRGMGSMVSVRYTRAKPPIMQAVIWRNL